MNHLREFEEFDASEFDDLFALGFEDVWDHCTMEFYIQELSVYLFPEDDLGLVAKEFYKGDVPESLMSFIKDLAESKAHTVMERKQVKTYTNGVRIMPEFLVLSVNIDYAQRDLLAELQKLGDADRWSGKLGELTSKIISGAKDTEARYSKLMLSALWKRADDHLVQNFGSGYVSSDNSDQYVKGAFQSAAKLYGHLPTQIFEKKEVTPSKVSAMFYSAAGKEIKKWSSTF